MNSCFIVKRLHGLLKPIGFIKQGATWNRPLDQFIDVVNIQTSKSWDAVTVNAGVVYPAAFTKCREEDLPRFIAEPKCTVRARIGELIDGKDMWWNLTSPDVEEAIVEKVEGIVLPFLGKVGTGKVGTGKTLSIVKFVAVVHVWAYANLIPTAAGRFRP